MYLHIGNEKLVQQKNIIGIFDIDSLKKSEEYDNIMESLKNNIVDVTKDKKKTLIITIENNIKKGYISNILSTTLYKRAKANF